jgi:hypothetical protein
MARGGVDWARVAEGGGGHIATNGALNFTRQGKCYKWYLFLGAFAKLRKGTTSFVMSLRPSVCLSVHPSVRVEKLGSYWTDFN